MSNVNCESAIPWNVNSKPFVFSVAGGIAFTVAAVALCCFMLTAQPSLATSHVVSYALIGAAGAAGLVSFMLGIYFYRKQQQEELAQFVQDIGTMQPITVDKLELPPSNVATLDYIEKVRKDLPPLFDSVGTFMLALNKGYYKLEGKNPPNETKITQVKDLMKKHIDEFLKNPKEVLRVAIGIVSFALLDEDKMGALLKKSNGQVLACLADALAVPDQGFETQSKIIAHILKVLAQKNQGNLRVANYGR